MSPTINKSKKMINSFNINNTTMKANNILGRNILLILVSLLGFSHLKATHIVAGNITYKHISGDDYQITLTLRRDCLLGAPDAQFDNPASVWIFTGGGVQATWLGNNGVIRMPFMSSDTLNEYIRSDCGFEGTQVCVHQTTYRSNVRLPFRAGGYLLAYQRCCRNETILNITDPKQTGATYWTEVSEKALQLRNNSPVFREWPDVYICANKPLVFDHGATDIDGDSLVYKLCTPSSGATLANPKPDIADPPPYDLVNWRAPYGLDNMFGGTPLKINSKTGEFTGMPNLVGQFLVGVCVEEYRKGVLIGTTRRDFQYNMRICSQPPLAQFTTSESNCDGLTVEFFNNSLSSSAYVWDFNYPSNDPAFKSTVRNPTFTFPQSGVYVVRLRATRGTDGCFDTLLQTVSVFTNKIQPATKFSLSGCEINSDSLTVQLADESIFIEPGYVLNGWQWTLTQNGLTTIVSGKNPKVRISKSGIISVKLVIDASNGCSSAKDFTIDPLSLIPNGDFAFAAAGCTSTGLANLNLSNLSAPLNPFATITNTSWNINGITATGLNPSVQLPQSTTDILAKMTVSFSEECDITIEKNFSLQSLFPQTNAQLSGVECPQDDKVTLKLSYQNTNSLGIDVTSSSWTTTSAGSTNNYSGNTISFTIPKDSLLSYTLITAFANGCIDTINNSLIPGPYAQIKFQGDTLILCPGQKKTFVTNSNPAWQYTWSPTTGLDLTDPSNPIVSIDQNIKYTVTVTDGLCSVNGSFDVIALTGGVELSIVGDTISCDGKVSLDASGGIGQGQYTWAIDPNINNVIATGESINTTFSENSKTYYVQFVGQSCSTEPAQITVFNQAPNIEDASPLTICKGDTAKILTVNLVPFHQNTIIWQPNSHIISGGSTYTPTVGIGANETNPFFLVYEVTNQFGCKLIDTFNFNIGVNPVVDFTSDFKECGKNEFCFDLDGTYNGFISWDFGDPNTNNDKSLLEDPCYTYNQPGTYNVVLTNLVDVCPFKGVSETVVINPPLQVIAGQDQVLCFGDTLKLKATSNFNNVEYTWLNGNVSVSNTSTYVTVLNTDANFVVNIVDQYGCKDADTLSARVFKFDYNVSIPDSICINENGTVTLNLNNSSDYNITWGPADLIVSGGNSTSPIIKGVNGSLLTLMLTHKGSGCESNQNFSPKVTKPFEFKIEAPSILCFEQPIAVTLDINNPDRYNYVWSPAECFVGNTTLQNPTIKISSDKTIKVVVTERSSGCKQEKSYLALAGENISVDIDAKPDFVIYEGKDLDLYIKDGFAGDKYLWSTGETGDTIVVAPKESTTYSVTVTDVNGCTGTDLVTVEVRNAKCDESDIYIPNAFSPNQDGVNDILYVRSNFIDILEIIIYNRWGQEVFRSNDQSIGWDGTLNGNELAPDAYAYYLKANCINGETYTKKGNVSLLR
jgi:gliding motility-associated-like protein